MLEKVRLGMIGLGNMGTSHSRSLVDGKVPGLELTAIADCRPERRDWAKANLPQPIAWYDSADDLIDRADVDAVLIAVPHYGHVPLGIRALERGLHVMCEKPIAVSVGQARKLIDAADRSGRVFAIMLNQRTNPLYRRMRQIMAEGELGALKRSNWIITTWYRTQNYYDSGDWRATWSGEGGGVLINQCPHNLDLWQWICGMPTRVQAVCHEGKWHDIEVEDDVTAYVEYENGATGVLVTSTGDTPGTNRLEILCDRGKMVCEDDRLRICRLDQPEHEFRVQAKGFGQPGNTWEEVVIDGENLQHVGILRAFTDHLREGKPLVADGREGIHSLMLSNAMYLSGWLGKPVDLPIDDALFEEYLARKIAGSRRKPQISQVSDIAGSF